MSVQYVITVHHILNETNFAGNATVIIASAFKNSENINPLKRNRNATLFQ